MKGKRRIMRKAAKIESSPDPEDDLFVEVERPKFLCAMCSKNFSDRNCLKKHIKLIHRLEPEPYIKDHVNTVKITPFTCRVCNTGFSYKRNLKRHLIKYHSLGLDDQEGGNCFCYFEGCKFRSFFINALRTHLTEEHQVSIEVEHKVFNSKSGFDEWKEDEEKTNVCLFIKEAGKHTLINGDEKLIFQCHRSGHYNGHGFGKRSFRIKGTCKLGKRCTAGIDLTIKRLEDVYEVVYYKTHIWHTADVNHINLSASERAYLAQKLKEGASIASILEQVKADTSEDGTSLRKRIHLLKRKDLVNIENTFRLNNTERHLRKLHQKGMKIERERIKSNLGMYDEPVSWVIETLSGCDTFTVKKLQSKRCVEYCGVACEPCNTCLHMYSCTCHDYLLCGTMCPHQHAVVQSMRPITKRRRSPKSGAAKIGGPKKRRQHVAVDDAVGPPTSRSPSPAVETAHEMAERLRLEQRTKLHEKALLFQENLANRMDELDEKQMEQLSSIIDMGLDALAQHVPAAVETEAPSEPTFQHFLTKVADPISTSVHSKIGDSTSVPMHPKVAEPNTTILHPKLAEPSSTTMHVKMDSMLDRRFDYPQPYYGSPTVIRKRQRRPDEPEYRPIEKKYDPVELMQLEYGYDCTWQTQVNKWWT